MKKTSAKFLAAAAAFSLMMQTAVIASADSAAAEQDDISAQIISQVIGFMRLSFAVSDSVKIRKIVI